MKKYRTSIFVKLFTGPAIICLLWTLQGCSATNTVTYPFYPPNSQIKNIVFLIGDGMGMAQIASARIKTYGAGGRLYIEKMPVTGLINTHSADKLVTCSAAAGTALATGHKTNNGMVSINPEGKSFYTILEACRDRGMSTGMVVTSAITNATPAVFAAHVKSRKDEAAIAPQLLENRVNVLLGGGRMFFLPQSDTTSKRKDTLDLIAKARETGYEFIQTKEELNVVKGDYILGLFQLGGLTNNPPEPSLAEMTQKAIEQLSRNEKGFFLMVEGSQIDLACHKNNPDNAITKTLLFDEAVKKAVDFASMDKHTLVVVTADHETGGMAINDGSLDGRNLTIGWTSLIHTGMPVPIFAFGPQAELFTGIHDNTEVPRIFAQLLGIKSFPRIND